MQENLTTETDLATLDTMIATIPKKGNAAASSASATIRELIERGGERFWHASDFGGLSALAVSQALSRLAKSGDIQRVRKGTYYRARQTAFGTSKPSRAEIARRALGSAVRPAGLTATNLLGLSTQNSETGEFATPANNAYGAATAGALVYTRRPESWKTLSDREAAILDVFRSRAQHSELSDEETADRLIELLREGDTFERLVAVAGDEPPRVRAILGALGQQFGASATALESLRHSLNPISRFEFGKLRCLKHAREWQVK